MSTESEFETHATDPTRAEYYLVRGAFEPEADMRADFTVGYRHWQAAQETAGAERQALLNQHEELARKWCPPGAPAEWGRLDHAVAGWERYPRQMREHGDWIAASQDRTRGELPIDRRTQQHAR